MILCKTELFLQCMSSSVLRQVSLYTLYCLYRIRRGESTLLWSSRGVQTKPFNSLVRTVDDVINCSMFMMTSSVVNESTDNCMRFVFFTTNLNWQARKRMSDCVARRSEFYFCKISRNNCTVSASCNTAHNGVT